MISVIKPKHDDSLNKNVDPTVIQNSAKEDAEFERIELEQKIREQNHVENIIHTKT